MKTNFIVLGMLIATVINSCIAPSQLPKSKEIDVNQYGSYIHVKRSTGTHIRGELIAIDSSQLVILIDSNHVKKSVVIPIKEISRFNLRYAKQKDYVWTIPVYVLVTIGHGWFLILTAPVNFITTVFVISDGGTDFQYTDKEMTYEKLKMFARFPQGIPPNIDLASIK